MQHVVGKRLSIGSGISARNSSTANNNIGLGAGAGHVAAIANHLVTPETQTSPGDITENNEPDNVRKSAGID